LKIIKTKKCRAISDPACDHWQGIVVGSAPHTTILDLSLSFVCVHLTPLVEVSVHFEHKFMKVNPTLGRYRRMAIQQVHKHGFATPNTAMKVHTTWYRVLDIPAEQRHQAARVHLGQHVTHKVPVQVLKLMSGMLLVLVAFDRAYSAQFAVGFEDTMTVEEFIHKSKWGPAHCYEKGPNVMPKMR
jgi:hypothetical protein